MPRRGAKLNLAPSRYEAWYAAQLAERASDFRGVPFRGAGGAAAGAPSLTRPVCSGLPAYAISVRNRPLMALRAWPPPRPPCSRAALRRVLVALRVNACWSFSEGVLISCAVSILRNSCPAGTACESGGPTSAGAAGPAEAPGVHGMRDTEDEHGSDSDAWETASEDSDGSSSGLSRGGAHIVVWLSGFPSRYVVGPGPSLPGVQDSAILGL